MLWTVIHESVFRNTVAGPEVVRGQVAALLKTAERPEVRIQIVGGHVPVTSPFAILRFPDPEQRDIVYLEFATGALYLEDQDEVDRYTADWDRCGIEAESPRASLDILRDILRD